MEKLYDAYVAGPFFNEEQLNSMQDLENLLESHNLKLYKPRVDAGVINKDSSPEKLKETFDNDLYGINYAKCIIANVTFKDTGTSFELGYAYANKIPIYLYNDESKSGRKINLMLGISAEATFNSLNDLDDFLSIPGQRLYLEDKVKNIELE